MKGRLPSILSGIAFAATLASAPSTAADAGDDFLAARDAFRLGDARRLDQYAARLQNYVLEPYVAYWRLRMRLDEASAADVGRFMTT